MYRSGSGLDSDYMLALSTFSIEALSRFTRSMESQTDAVQQPIPSPSQSADVAGPAAPASSRPDVLISRLLFKLLHHAKDKQLKIQRDGSDSGARGSVKTCTYVDSFKRAYSLFRFLTFERSLLRASFVCCSGCFPAFRLPTSDCRSYLASFAPYYCSLILKPAPPYYSFTQCHPRPHPQP